MVLRYVLSEYAGVKAAIADLIGSKEELGYDFLETSISSMTHDFNNYEVKKSNIMRIVYERDNYGHIIRQTYHSNNDYNLSRSATSDVEGVYGAKFVLDSLGRCTQITYINSDGMPMVTKRGVSGRLYE